MFALISLLVVLSLSMLVIRIGTLALGMTGMSREAAADHRSRADVAGRA